MLNDIKDFYPTPLTLINKMLNKIDFSMINNVLEPSAGKGDIVDIVKNKFKFSRYYNKYDKDIKWDIDCIEINQNLQYILQGKSYRVVHDDFLTFDTYKHYDLIVANFPFSEDDKHLHKALDLQERTGGKIVCLVNADTLRNPYSNSRQYLLQRLEEHNAEIEYIENAFIDEERSTYVTVALIYIDIPKPEGNSTILEDLKKEENFKVESEGNSSNIIDSDFIKGIVAQYNFEVKAGLKLIAEYKAMSSLIMGSFDSIITCGMKIDNYNYSTDENVYIQRVRAKYWETLFKNDKFMGLFTSNLKEKYYNKVSELVDYDFSLYNIYSIRVQLNKEMVQGVEETILALFEDFSNKHHWYDEMSKNIHYFNGWKTNSAYKINKKVIIPLAGFRDMEYSWGKFEPTHYKTVDKLTDIEKIFNYLDGGITEDVSLLESLKMAEHYGETKKIETKYFSIDFFKKGTCHLTFLNDDLLQKFNLFGSQRKGWIPPCYGKKKYNDMTPEEKQTIDEFEGEISYNKVMSNKDYYIVETSKLLLLNEAI